MKFSNPYTKEQMEYFRKKGAKGGRTAAQRMTEEERQKRASKASQARWKARKEEVTQ